MSDWRDVGFPAEASVDMEKLGDDKNFVKVTVKAGGNLPDNLFIVLSLNDKWYYLRITDTKKQDGYDVSYEALTTIISDADCVDGRVNGTLYLMCPDEKVYSTTEITVAS